jgi:hypothetical protein
MRKARTGVGILYSLIIEGLLSAFADSVSLLEPLTHVFLRANGYRGRARGLRRVDRVERAGILLRTVRGQRAGTGGARRLHRHFLGLSASLLRRRDVA